ncbi:MAG TPA: 3-phosphoshikimate 1-carboxyvinyltransferase [Terriglobales bacterium]|jgi:3-phosphoshikimate 1-carboxyvinyltransferase
MAEMVINGAARISGAVRLPGDKSLSHRCALLGAIADGDSVIENYSGGADCQSSLSCIEALGVKVERDAEMAGKITIHGVGLHGLREPGERLDAGNSGSTMRMLSGILAPQPFATSIGGDSSLSRRPMRRIIAPLTGMGARIEAEAGGLPPLRFAPARGLHGISYALPVASAQVKSAILFAGLYAQGTTQVTEPVPTRDHSEVLLRAMGVPLRRGRQIELTGPVERLAPLEKFFVPGDPSSAAFFLCAAAALPESDLLVSDVSLNPTRSALLDVLARMGAKASVASIEEESGEIIGNLHLDGPRQRLTGTTLAGAEAAALIDEIPILAVLATATRDGIEFRDVAELRVKESDRIRAIAENLRAMGAQCDEREDGLFVPGQQTLRGATIASHGDHRIAMAFAIAGLLAEQGQTLITDAGCASVSYPGFFSDLERLTDH